jgi:hypothetical protein
MSDLGGYCSISWARSKGVFRIGLGRCWLALLFCSPAIADDTNPYAAPAHHDEAHKRISFERTWVISRRIS